MNSSSPEDCRSWAQEGLDTGDTPEADPTPSGCEGSPEQPEDKAQQAGWGRGPGMGSELALQTEGRGGRPGGGQAPRPRRVLWLEVS